MPDDNQDFSQSHPDQSSTEQAGQVEAQSTPVAPPPFQPVSIVQQLKSEAEEPGHKERPLDPQESAEAVEELIQLFRQTLSRVPAFSTASTQKSEDGFVLFTLGEATYSVFDQTDTDGTTSMLIKKVASSEANNETLRDFSPTDGATQLLMNSFPASVQIEAVIAFESPTVHWTMRDTAGEEFPWPVQNTTLAVAQAAKLVAELAPHPTSTQ